MNNNRRQNPLIRIFIMTIFAMCLLAVLTYVTGFSGSKEYSYDEFLNTLETESVEKLTITPKSGIYSITGQLKTEENKPKEYFTATMPVNDEILKTVTTLAAKKNVKIEYGPEVEPFNWLNLIMIVSLFGFAGLLLFKMTGGKNNPMSVGENKARLNVKSDKMFSDVIGYEEEKNELVEIIDFLKNPTMYKEMGANIPNGVLLEGPPGTGKTLMAKAVAGEAGVAFYSISGSDFIEMFVGVGASRVRSLFKEAKKNGPSIVFIDEIDAIGSRDNGGPGGRNTEQEQTINALLVELDGFATDAGKGQIIIIGATNRADKLDKALLRPGRFDRKVMMGLPEMKAREDILVYHANKRKFDESVDFVSLSRSTSGMSGAQLEAVVNEAAILAVREKTKLINQQHVDEAVDRVLMGPAKISNKYSKMDKKMVSYHESGHAITGLELEGGMQVQKITIIPRRDAGGYVSYIPSEEEERFITKTQLESRLISLMAGRASEELFIGDVTVGAYNDFEQATAIARAMVTKYGMTSLGTYQCEPSSHDNAFAVKPYSEQTAQKIDEMVSKLLDESYKKAKEILTKRSDDVHLLAKTIQEVETLTKEEIDYLMEHRELKEIVESEKFTDQEIDEIHEREAKILQEEIELKEKKNKKGIVNDKDN